jgi:hypothetical protein
MPNDYTYARTGWNKRGPTVAMQLENALERSELLNPDSDHWAKKAIAMRNQLSDEMGWDEFNEWVVRLFPEETIELHTWKEIFELYEAHLKVCQMVEREAELHDPNNDPRHLKTNGVY